MDWTSQLLARLGPGDLLGLGALLLSLYVAWGNRKMATVDAFDKLCKALQGRIDANDREIAALKAELAQYRSENEVLRGRVRDLEIENTTLKAQLDELQKRRKARKGT